MSIRQSGDGDRLRLVGLEREEDELGVAFDLQHDRLSRCEPVERRAQTLDRRDRRALDAVDRIAGLQPGVRRLPFVFGVADDDRPLGARQARQRAVWP